MAGDHGGLPHLEQKVGDSTVPRRMLSRMEARERPSEATARRSFIARLVITSKGKMRDFATIFKRRLGYQSMRSSSAMWHN